MEASIIDVLIGIDIGLIVLYVSTYLKLKKLLMQEEVNYLMLNALVEDEELSKIIREKLKKFEESLRSRGYAPLRDVLRSELKYLKYVLIIYNVILFVLLLYSNF